VLDVRTRGENVQDYKQRGETNRANIVDGQRRTRDINRTIGKDMEMMELRSDTADNMHVKILQ
jgi:hypothetical protein